MPALVRTPEQILRREKKDLYVIRSNEADGRDAPGLLMVQKWVRDNLPGTNMEHIAPSEYSGIVEGGIGRTVWVDFSAEGLERFCARWEIDNASVDKRFQCYIYSYHRWLKEYGCYVPTMNRPSSVGPIVWWYTPAGFLHHQLHHGQCSESRIDLRHPSVPQDIWFHVPEIFPFLANLDTNTLANGYVWTNRDGQATLVTWEEPWLTDQLTESIQPNEITIREWFNLAKSVPIKQSSI